MFSFLKKRRFLLPLALLLVASLAVYAYASTTLSAKLTIQANSRFVEALDLSNPTDVLALDLSQSFTAGAGNKQVTKLFHDTRTLADGATENLDLAGVLVDPYGSTITFTAVKAIVFKNKSTTQTFSVGGAATAQFINWVADASDIVKVPPEGVFVLTAPNAGFAVTATTGDLFKVANSAGAAADYQVWIIGN